MRREGSAKAAPLQERFRLAEEIELKLAASADVLSAVRSHPAVAAIARGRSRTMHLSTTYFDTPQRDLAAAGVSLRVREAGGRWLQTVKGGGAVAGGLHRRAEFEWPLTTPRLDRDKLAHTPWRKLFEAKHGYRRVFATEFRRSEQPIAFADGTRAKLCLDVGEIRAGRRRVPVSEIEVELQAGDPSRLFELASALAADLPVRIEPASKAARGYALATQADVEPRRAHDVDLGPDASVSAALATLGAECVSQMEINAAAMAAGGDPEFLHQLRVGWRRLKSLLKIAALFAASGSVEPLEAELRWLGGELGPARDYDVFALETLPRIAAQFRGEPGLRRLRARTAARRRKAGKRARDAAASTRVQKLLIALGAFFTALPRAMPADLPPLHDWVKPILDARQHKLRKRAKHAHRLGAQERHRARVAAKKLRYTSEFFTSLFPEKRGEAFVAALSKLQSSLGRLNDFQVAGRLIDQMAPTQQADAAMARATGLVHGWLAASTAAELKRLRDVQHAFRKCEPFWGA
jgi:inorganic triphosphatase YgiF